MSLLPNLQDISDGLASQSAQDDAQKGQIVALQAQLATAQAQVANLQNTITALQLDDSTAQAMVAKLTPQLAVAEGQVASLTAALAASKPAKIFTRLERTENNSKMNVASQQRLMMVWPALAAKIYKLSTLLAAENIFITVAEGLRTVEEQDALFAKGRDANGNVTNKALVVTNARGGNSYHNFGLAVDCYPVDQVGAVDWNPQHPQWKRMEELGVSLGLVSGANWIRLVDAPHFQLTGKFPEGAPSDELRALYAQGGLQAVWDQVMKPTAVTA